MDSEVPIISLLKDMTPTRGIEGRAIHKENLLKIYQPIPNLKPKSRTHVKNTDKGSRPREESPKVPAAMNKSAVHSQHKPHKESSSFKQITKELADIKRQIVKGYEQRKHSQPMTRESIEKSSSRPKDRHQQGQPNLELREISPDDFRTPVKGERSRETSLRHVKTASTFKNVVRTTNKSKNQVNESKSALHRSEHSPAFVNPRESNDQSILGHSLVIDKPKIKNKKDGKKSSMKGKKKTSTSSLKKTSEILPKNISNSFLGQQQENLQAGGNATPLYIEMIKSLNSEIETMKIREELNKERIQHLQELNYESLQHITQLEARLNALNRSPESTRQNELDALQYRIGILSQEKKALELLVRELLVERMAGNPTGLNLSGGASRLEEDETARRQDEEGKFSERLPRFNEGPYDGEGGEKPGNETEQGVISFRFSETQQQQTLSDKETT